MEKSQSRDTVGRNVGRNADTRETAVPLDASRVSSIAGVAVSHEGQPVSLQRLNCELTRITIRLSRQRPIIKSTERLVNT